MEIYFELFKRLPSFREIRQKSSKRIYHSHSFWAFLIGFFILFNFFIDLSKKIASKQIT